MCRLAPPVQFLLLAALVFPFGAFAQETPNDTVVHQYMIQPLDRVLIEVYREVDLTKVYKLSSDGTINHPLLGSVKLSGLAIKDAEKKVTELLEKDYLVKPQVNITIDEASARNIVVLGAVKESGSYSIPPDQLFTVSTAIAYAGGFNDVAAKDKVKIIRTSTSGKKTIRVNMKAFLSSDKDEPDVPLKPGDVVAVPESLF